MIEKKTYKNNTCGRGNDKLTRNSFLLDKRIKIINQSQPSEETDTISNKFELEFNYRYRKLFERKLPLNDLRNYTNKLFDEGKFLKLKSQPIYKVDNNSNNFETIELNGIITKVKTKLSKEDLNNEDNKYSGKEDYHKIMKHPLLVESFGYRFLRSLKHQGCGYKIYKNPLEDKDLIEKIHNLIINPSTIQFRNANLMRSSTGFFKNKKVKSLPKDYRTLSQRGLIRLRKDRSNRIKKEIEKNNDRIEIIRKKLNFLMEKNIKLFKEHRREVDEGKIQIPILL